MSAVYFLIPPTNERYWRKGNSAHLLIGAPDTLFILFLYYFGSLFTGAPKFIAAAEESKKIPEVIAAAIG